MPRTLFSRKNETIGNGQFLKGTVVEFVVEVDELSPAPAGFWEEYDKNKIIQVEVGKNIEQWYDNYVGNAKGELLRQDGILAAGDFPSKKEIAEAQGIFNDKEKQFKQQAQKAIANDYARPFNKLLQTKEAWKNY